MDTNVAIFTVFSWWTGGSIYEGEMHYVAGLNSADAERRIKEYLASIGGELSDDSFITTDASVEWTAGASVRLAIHNGTLGMEIGKPEYEEWVATSTSPSVESGEIIPAMFRKI